MLKVLHGKKNSLIVQNDNLLEKVMKKLYFKMFFIFVFMANLNAGTLEPLATATPSIDLSGYIQMQDAARGVVYNPDNDIYYTATENYYIFWYDSSGGAELGANTNAASKAWTSMWWNSTLNRLEGHDTANNPNATFHIATDGSGAVTGSGTEPYTLMNSAGVESGVAYDWDDQVYWQTYPGNIFK
jgi:hypothetical protein